MNRTAIHEAGHAVAAFHYGRGIRFVTVIPGRGYRGLCRSDGSLSPWLHAAEFGGPDPFGSPEDFRRYEEMGFSDEGKVSARLRQEVVVFLAGRQAERVHLRRSDEDGAASDREKAVDLLLAVAGGDVDAVCPLYRKADRQARRLLSLPANRAAVLKLAGALQRRKRLTGKEAFRIYQAAVAAHQRKRD